MSSSFVSSPKKLILFVHVFVLSMDSVFSALLGRIKSSTSFDVDEEKIKSPSDANSEDHVILADNNIALLHNRSSDEVVGAACSIESRSTTPPESAWGDVGDNKLDDFEEEWNHDYSIDISSEEEEEEEEDEAEIKPVNIFKPVIYKPHSIWTENLPDEDDDDDDDDDKKTKEQQASSDDDVNQTKSLKLFTQAFVRFLQQRGHNFSRNTCKIGSFLARKSGLEKLFSTLYKTARRRGFTGGHVATTSASLINTAAFTGAQYHGFNKSMASQTGVDVDALYVD
jgi:hypothetical protein